MSALDILVVTPEGPVADTIGSYLRRRGHEVSHARTRAEARRAGRFDVLVTDSTLADGDGFDLISELRSIGIGSRAVVLTDAPSVDTFRRALLCGEVQILLKPVQLERLLLLVEDREEQPVAERRAAQPVPPSIVPAQSGQAAEHPHEFQRVYSAGSSSLERCCRDLGAFATGLGLGPAVRCRVLTAVAEIVDNALRHGYSDGGGRVLVTAFLTDGKRLSVVVQDFGTGIRSAHSPGMSGDRDEAEHGGLERADALCERLRVDSSAGTGTRVELEFAVWPVRFDGDDWIDLSDLDWLPPSLSRKVVARLRDGQHESPFRLSPALAVTVGRLIAGPDPERELARSLRGGGR